jgi:trimethylamine--corrinoid protein Co-methyltransferase
MFSELLSPADIDEIHNASVRLLADVGVQFPDDEAIGVFRQHGIRTDSQTVYLEAVHHSRPQPRSKRGRWRW